MSFSRLQMLSGDSPAILARTGSKSTNHDWKMACAMASSVFAVLRLFSILSSRVPRIWAMRRCSSMEGILTTARLKSFRTTRGITAPEINSDFRYEIVYGAERYCLRYSANSFFGFGLRIATDDSNTTGNDFFIKHVVSKAVLPSLAIKTSPTFG